MPKMVKVAVYLVTLLLNLSCYAGNPLWTITPNPDYPPQISLTSTNSTTIKYTITNNSHRPHTLVMKPIQGITQITSAGNCPSSFTLAYKQSCTLNLLVNGSLLSGNIYGGPIICQQGSMLECYQPSIANTLNIIFVPLAKYLITPLMRMNGVITPNTPQTVYAGTNLTFRAIPSVGYQVDRWLVDGGIAQKGGSTLTLSQIDANHTVEASFTRSGIIYAGTASGCVYFSTDNGLTWNASTPPSSGYSVNGVFANASTLYAASADGKVYYSTNNGSSWNATSAVSGNSPVNSVFVLGNGSITIYCGTQDGHVYYSTDGSTWTATANPGTGAVNSLFITPTSTIYAGSQDGNVYYSLNNGTSWHLINGPETSSSVPVYNVFATNSQLYVNTRQTTSNDTLPPGTIDFEYTYASNSLTDANPIWSLLSQITYTLFVNADASLIYAGTQGGYVFSLTTGDELGFVTYSPITSLYFLD